jgi:hypothetical protein
MSFVRVLKVLGRTAAGNGGTTVPSHAALRVLMVLPTWPLRGWVGLVLAVVISGTVCVVVLVVVGTRDPARNRVNADRPPENSYLKKGRKKKR